MQIQEQNTTFSLPPSSPTQAERTPAALKGIVFLAGVLLFALLYESWLQKSDFMRAAREQLAHNDRVRAEFGDDVRLVGALAWNLDGAAYIYGYAKGHEASGVAVIEMRRQAGAWAISGGEIRNQLEDHVLTLYNESKKAEVGQLQAWRRLYLVAIGSSAHDEVQDLAKYFKSECNVQAEVLPDMELPAQGFDESRKQWIADMLIESIAQSFPNIAGDQEARIIAIIDADIYPRSLGWDFTFNLRDANKYAVIQTAALNPSFSGRKPSTVIMTERLRKIALKCLGLLYFDFKDSGRTESVMGFEGTLKAVDEQSAHYLASDIATRPASDNFPGRPCLTFSTVNVSGVPRLAPIESCHEPYDLSRESYVQINLSNGELRTERNDIYRSGALPFVLRRMYASHIYDAKVRAFGRSTWHDLDDTVWSVDPGTIQEININGVEFKRITPGIGFSPQAKYRAGREEGEFSDALLSWEGGWKIQTSTGVWRYLGCDPNSRVPCYFMQRTSLYGDRVRVERDADGHIQRAVQVAAGRLPSSYSDTWTFAYDGDRIQEIKDTEGQQSLRYRYDADSYLQDIESSGSKLHYDYDQSHRMTSINENGQSVAIQYDDEGRVVGIEFAGSPMYRIQYTGETVQVTAPKATYVVAIRDTYFHLDRKE